MGNNDYIRIDLDTSRAFKTFDRIAAVTARTAPLMRNIAGIMQDEVEENFAQQGRPKWLGLKPSSLQSEFAREMTTRKGKLRKHGLARFARAVAQKQILQRSGRLAASISAQSSAHEAIVGSNVVYAAIQHFGGKTRPHVILPRNKRALAFAGHIVKRVNHPGSTIPARPFLVLGPTGEDRIVGAASAFLRTAIQ